MESILLTQVYLYFSSVFELFEDLSKIKFYTDTWKL